MVLFVTGLTIFATGVIVLLLGYTARRALDEVGAQVVTIPWGTDQVRARFVDGASPYAIETWDVELPKLLTAYEEATGREQPFILDIIFDVHEDGKDGIFDNTAGEYLGWHGRRAIAMYDAYDEFRAGILAEELEHAREHSLGMSPPDIGRRLHFADPARSAEIIRDTVSGWMAA